MYGPLVLVTAVVVGVGSVVAFALARAWVLLLLVPPVLGLLAWYGWEFYGPALPYAIFIGVLGYVALGIGLALRTAVRRALR